jgi:flagellar protein FliL
MAEAAKKAPEPIKGKDKELNLEAQPNQQKPKIELMTVLLLAVVLVNMLAVGFMGSYMKKMWSKIHDLQLRAQKAEREADPTFDNDKKKDVVGKELHPSVGGPLYPMESFLVNIASDTGPKFLQTQMELELTDPALEDEVTRKKAALRDAIIVLLSSRTYKDLREPSGMKALRTDILKAMNNLLTTGKVREIYFTQFHFN